MTTAINLPLDRDGFLRRECPFCERQFKIRAGELDSACIQREVTRQLPHHNADETALATLPRVGCIYCGKSAPMDVWFTPQQRAYLERVAEALAEEIRFEQLSHVQRTLTENPYPTFVPVPPLHKVRELEPEPDDMKPASFICCAEDAKAERHWKESLYCPRCGVEHRPSTRRLELPLTTLIA